MAAYGLGGTLNESSRFYNHTARVNTTLPAPVLNVSIFASPDERLGGQNSSQVLNVTWARDNQTFDYAYMKEYGTCQNTGVSARKASRLEFALTHAIGLQMGLQFPAAIRLHHTAVRMDCGHLHHVDLHTLHIGVARSPSRTDLRRTPRRPRTGSRYAE